EMEEAEREHRAGEAPAGAGGEEQVRGLEVAVDDAEGVGLGERLAGLEDPGRRGADGERTLSPQDRGEVIALEELHDDERRAGLERDDVEHARAVRALELRRRHRLADEAGAHLGVLQRLGEDELDGDALLEVEVGGFDDAAHAALAEDALDAILADEYVTDDRVAHQTWLRGHTIARPTETRCFFGSVARPMRC